MLPGARAGSSGDRTRLDRTSCPGPSMMMPNGFARWRIPGETGSQRAASRRVLARTGASRTQSGNDVRTTSPRLRGELRLTLDTLSHIRLCSSHLWRSIHCAGACNFFWTQRRRLELIIAPFVDKFIAPASRKKRARRRRGERLRRFPLGWMRSQCESVVQLTGPRLARPSTEASRAEPCP